MGSSSSFGTMLRAAAAGMLALGSKGAALAKSGTGLKGVTMLAGAGAAATAAGVGYPPSETSTGK